MSSGTILNSSTTFNGSLQQYAYEMSTPTRRVTRASTSITPLPQTTLNQSLKRKSSSPASNPSSSKPSLFTEPDVSPALAKKPKLKRASSGYAPPGKYAHLGNNLTDSLAQSLICVFIGVNPGIRTATTGHAYNHPSNLFWKLLQSSGATPRRCRPEEDGNMPELYSLGLTNIVSRPTKDAGELSKEEMDEGVAILEEKTRRFRPESVAIVGKGIWESVFRVRHGRKIKKEEFRYGWQENAERMGVIPNGEEKWEGAKVFVTTTTSGLAAGMRPHEKEEVWRPLGEWIERRRAERGVLLEDGHD